MTARTTANYIVEPGATAKRVAATLVISDALITMIRSLDLHDEPEDAAQSISYPPKVFFTPPVEG